MELGQFLTINFDNLDMELVSNQNLGTALGHSVFSGRGAIICVPDRSMSPGVGSILNQLSMDINAHGLRY